MAADEKSLLAMDVSIAACSKRFDKVGIAQTEEARRSYREMILTTPGLGEFISGVFLYDETIRQARKDGTRFGKVITDVGINPGFKVDIGVKDMAGHAREKINDGFRDLQREEACVLLAQQALYHQARCNRAARRGEYNAAMERT
jgi:fructose-bisphosphate aldolase class I